MRGAEQHRELYGVGRRCGTRPGGPTHLRDGPRCPTAAPDAPHGLGKAATAAPRGTARSVRAAPVPAGRFEPLPAAPLPSRSLGSGPGPP